MPSAARSPHNDGAMTAHATKQLTVEAFLIWTYQAQRADAMTAASSALSAERKLAWSRMSGDGVAACARNAALGGPIFGGGVSLALHPDAELCHVEVGELPEPARGLVRHYGRTGSAPEWFPGAEVERLPVLRANGKPLRLYDSAGHLVGIKTAEFISWGGRRVAGSMASLLAARAAYAAWHGGLVELVRRLSGGRLTAHRLGGPASPASPWQ